MRRKIIVFIIACTMTLPSVSFAQDGKGLGPETKAFLQGQRTAKQSFMKGKPTKQEKQAFKGERRELKRNFLRSRSNPNDSDPGPIFD